MIQPKLSIITSCYKGEEYLKTFFENVAEQTFFDRTEIVFIHNSPSQAEILLVKEFEDKYPDHIQNVKLESVEPLGASWNRGWHSARGEYLAIWNVDDRRVPDSLARQAQTLDQYQDCWLTYGDYIVTVDPSDRHGVFMPTPEFKRRMFLRGFPSGGAFLMWRKEVSEITGFFDEQFKSALDFDYVARMTLSGLALVRTQGLIGYFTNASRGLSNKEGALSPLVEVTVIQIRYAIYDQIKFEYLEKANNFHIDQFYFDGAWHTAVDLIPEYRAYCRSQRYLRVIEKPRNFFRFLFMKLGLWSFYLRIRTKFLIIFRRI